MGQLRNTEPWVKVFRDQVRLSTMPNWKVLNSRGRMRLQVTGEGSVMLPYEWSQQATTHALPRIQQIFKRWKGGALTLTAAAQTAETSSSNQKIDFDALIKSFREFVPNAGEKTWQEHYLPVLRNCKQQFAGTNPKDGESLCMACLAQWEQGSRMRTISRQKLTKFLDWAIDRGLLKTSYRPPKHLPEIIKPKRPGYALSDIQILELLEEIPDQRWQFGIQLCAVYGLRPEELRWLRIKEGASGKELWTIYQKSAGGNKGQKTSPRRLHPLLLRGANGKPIDWELQSRIEAREELPPLQREGDGAQAVNQYLSRRKSWAAFQALATENGEKCTAYSFRHRYAKATHAAGLPVAEICHAMGHTIETHLDDYARFTPDNTERSFAQANAA